MKFKLGQTLYCVRDINNGDSTGYIKKGEEIKIIKIGHHFEYDVVVKSLETGNESPGNIFGSERHNKQKVYHFIQNKNSLKTINILYGNKK